MRERLFRRLNENVFEYESLREITRAYNLSDIIYNTDSYISSGGDLEDIVYDLENTGVDLETLVKQTTNRNGWESPWDICYSEKEDMYLLMNNWV